MRRAICAGIGLGLFVLPACDSGKEDKPKTTSTAAAKSSDAEKPEAGDDKLDGAAAPAWAWELPKGLTDPPDVPADNPMTAEKVALGHKLFMDKRLSADGTRSCYSCHQNHLGNADGRKTAMGPGEKILTRNSPTIWNVAYHKALYWDGRAPTLEKQALGALKGGNMGLGDGLAAKAEEMGNLDEYKGEFVKVFGLDEGAKVTPDHVAMALSAYERTLLCGDTKWDKQELSEAATRGQTLFNGKAGCITCHSGPNMTDGMFHVTGIGIDIKAEGADVGRFKVTKDERYKHAFRTPTLRNVNRTAPYFHDGSVDTLEDAVRVMATGGNPQDGLAMDALVVDRKLTDDEIKDVVAFLEHLECPGQLEEIGDQTAEGIAAPGA